MQKLKILLNLWFPVVFWMTFIFILSSIQVGSASEFYWKDFIVKKTAHLIEYGVLATLLYRGLKGSKIVTKKAMCYAIIISFLYAITDEFHQSFTPGRGPAIRDVFIDLIGATIFIYGILKNIKKMPKVLQNLYSQHQIA